MTLPSPQVRAGGDQAGLQLMVANIDYDSFKGKMGIGRLRSGKLKKVGRSVHPCAALPCWLPGLELTQAWLYLAATGSERGCDQAW